MANKFIAEVDAPEFGEGFTIRLDMHGQGVLETEFGAFDFAHKVGLGIAVMSATYLLAFLKVALRGPDGAVVKELPEVPPPIEPIARKCLDAFALFRYGKTHDEWVADNENQQPQKATKANPTKATKA
jgi:hypothetical protein